MNKSDILDSDDLKLERVDTQEWPKCQVVFIRTLTAAERDAYEAECYRFNGKNVSVNRDNVRARLLVRCIADETGARVFSDQDAEALGKKSARVLDRLFEVAQRLNGLRKEDVEDLEKNSG